MSLLDSFKKLVGDLGHHPTVVPPQVQGPLPSPAQAPAALTQLPNINDQPGPLRFHGDVSPRGDWRGGNLADSLDQGQNWNLEAAPFYAQGNQFMQNPLPQKGVDGSWNIDTADPRSIRNPGAPYSARGVLIPTKIKPRSQDPRYGA